MRALDARVVKLVDTGDSKSPALKSVPVRVRPLVPNIKKPAYCGLFYVCRYQNTLTVISIRLNLNILKHKRIITHSQRLSAGSGDVLENDRFGSDIGEFFMERLVRHLRI